MRKIRKFSISDLARVMEIEKVSFPNQEAWTENYFKNLYLKYPNGFQVAEESGKVLGYTIGQPKEDSGEILSLAVDLGWRQKGIGTELTNLLIEHFKKKGFKKIFLHARTKNNEGISFYQNLGFKILKTIKNYYRNGDDAYLMEKKI